MERLRAGQTLATIAIRDADDPLMMAAVMSSATAFPAEMLQRILDHGSPRGAQIALLENLLRLVLESEDRLRRWRLRAPANCQPRRGSVRNVAVPGDGGAGGRHRGQWRHASRGARSAVLPSCGRRSKRPPGLFSAARRDVVDATLDPERRLHAVRLVGRGLERQADDVRLLADQLTASTPVRIQQQIVEVLGILRPDDLPDVLLEQWAQHGPEIRPQILEDVAAAARLDARTVGSHRRGRCGRERNRRRESQQADLAQLRPTSAVGRLNC